MTPYSFGRMLKLAMDPRPSSASLESGAPANLTANVGGQLVDPTPNYEPDPGLSFRRQRHYDQVNSAWRNTQQAMLDAQHNANDVKNMRMLGAVAPAVGAAAGQLTGQQTLGSLAGMAGTLGSALSAHSLGQQQPEFDQRFQQEHANYKKLVPPKQILSNGYDTGSARPDSYFNRGR